MLHETTQQHIDNYGCSIVIQKRMIGNGNNHIKKKRLAYQPASSNDYI